MKEIAETNQEILKDIKGSESLGTKCESFLSQIKNYEKEQFDNWVYEVRDDIKVKGLSLVKTLFIFF